MVNISLNLAKISTNFYHFYDAIGVYGRKWNANAANVLTDKFILTITSIIFVSRNTFC